MNQKYDFSYFYYLNKYFNFLNLSFFIIIFNNFTILNILILKFKLCFYLILKINKMNLHYFDI